MVDSKGNYKFDLGVNGLKLSSSPFSVSWLCSLLRWDNSGQVVAVNHSLSESEVKGVDSSAVQSQSETDKRN